MVAGIENSREARDVLVKGWYSTYLGRSANGAEEQDFVKQLLAGQSEEQVFSAILGSQEFYDHAGALAGGQGTDATFVQALYQLLLNRTAGGDEVASQASNVVRVGRQVAARGILSSQEYRTGRFVGDYDALLHRQSDRRELDVLVFSNLDLYSGRLVFETSREFFLHG